VLSVVGLWSDYSALTDKLARSAEDDGDLGVAWALAKTGVSRCRTSGRSDASGPGDVGSD
jgi:hypothetical protein